MKILQLEWDSEIGPILFFNIENHRFGLCFCHKRKDRSFWFFGLENFFCSRCLGIVIGGIFGLLLFALYAYHVGEFFSLLFLLPLIIDGLFQAFGKRESTNTTRFVTGFIFGFGLQAIVGSVVHLIR